MFRGSQLILLNVRVPACGLRWNRDLCGRSLQLIAYVSVTAALFVLVQDNDHKGAPKSIHAEYSLCIHKRTSYSITAPSPPASHKISATRRFISSCSISRHIAINHLIKTTNVICMRKSGPKTRHAQNQVHCIIFQPVQD